MPVPIIDLIIVGATVYLAIWGFRNGLTVRMLVLAGLVLGAVLGSRLAPLPLEGGVRSTYAPILALPGAVLLGALAAAAVERYRLPLWRRLRTLGEASRFGGALLAGCLGIVAAWALNAVVKQVDSPVESSTILKGLNDVLPPPGPVVAAAPEPPDPFPRFEGPPPRVRRADPLITRDPNVRSAARSVLRVTAISCGHPASASGWVAAEGIVVTAAHAVSGADVVTIRDRDRKRRAQQATVIWLDRSNDVALLRSRAIRGAQPLPLVPEPKPGTSTAMLGFPRGRWTIKPARLARTTLVRVRFPGSREREPYRLGTLFRGKPEPGNSGGPLVDTRGRVLTTLSAGDAAKGGGFGVTNAVVSSALTRAREPVDTGACEGH